jgi:hypothetical protein
MAAARARIMLGFPSLASSFEITSEKTPEYNCIAWAAEDNSRWWCPTGMSYWPPTAPRQETVDAFIAAFGTLGYSPCPDGNLEERVEKVVVYLSNGVPTHMARQLPTGAWTSKLGQSWDIGHSSPEEVSGSAYGLAVQYLSRPRS